MEKWFDRNFEKVTLTGKSRTRLRVLSPENFSAVPPETDLWRMAEMEDAIWLGTEGASAVGAGLIAAQEPDGGCMIGVLPGADPQTVRSGLQQLYNARQTYPVPVRLLEERTDEDGKERFPYLV